MDLFRRVPGLPVQDAQSLPHLRPGAEGLDLPPQVAGDAAAVGIEGQEAKGGAMVPHQLGVPTKITG